MKGLKFLDIIVKGILNHESILKSYLIRKKNKFESKYFVSELEFIQRCSDMVLLLQYDIENQHVKAKSELYQAIELLKSNNEPFEKESELFEKLSVESFRVQLSLLTNDKLKGEIWYSQIMTIKKIINEISFQDIKFEVELRDLDIENYLNFVFSKKSISKETKENAVQILMDENKQEKTTLNYQIWNDYVFKHHNYWKELTEEDKKSFEELRIKSLEEMNTLFESTIKRSPKPKGVLEKEFENEVVNRLLNEPYLETTSDLVKGLLPKDLDKLAIVIGKIDFIKKLKKPKAPKTSERWYALLYWFELKVSGEEPPKDFEGNFNNIEIEKIGALKSKKSGQYFYKSFRTIDVNNHNLIKKMFGKDWKEKVKEISNYNTEIIMYLDENYT